MHEEPRGPGEPPGAPAGLEPSRAGDGADVPAPPSRTRGFGVRGPTTGARLHRGLAWGGAALAAAGLLAGCGAARADAAGAKSSPTSTPSCGSATPKLTVHGTGTAKGTPNQLTITLGVNVTGPTAQAALSDDNTKIAAVTAALRSGGVLAKDIQTTGLSIQPSYAKSGAISGYNVTNTVVATLLNFQVAGSVIDDAAGAAGNAIRIDGLSFSMSNPQSIADTARRDAVSQAVSHAQAMAAAAGEHLGSICSLTDTTSGSPGPIFNGFGAAASPARASAAVPLQPGSQEATADVTIVYALSAGPSGG